MLIWGNKQYVVNKLIEDNGFDKLKEELVELLYGKTSLEKRWIGKLWSMLIWGNKQYVVNKLIEDNGFDKLKEELVELLYGKTSLEKRWDSFLKSVKGLGPASMSELLTYVNPQEYVIFNKTTILCFTYLDIPNMPKYNYQYTGKKYVDICNIAKKISKELKKIGKLVKKLSNLKLSLILNQYHYMMK